MVSDNELVSSIVIGGKTHSRQTLLADSFSFDGLKSGKLTVYYRTLSSWNEQSKVIQDLTASDAEYQELFERYDAQCAFADKSIQEQLVEF